MHLSDTLATALLATRRRAHPAHPADAHPIPADATLDAIRARCLKAMALCGAQSGGVSIFDSQAHDELVWLSTAGVMRTHEGARFVLAESMCGVCFQYRAPQLFIKPHRYFRWMAQAGIEVAEALVAPLFGPFGGLYGTLWVMNHDADAGQFDQQDADSLAELGKGMYARIWSHDAARALTGAEAAKDPESN